jgi:hypothetical protein
VVLTGVTPESLTAELKQLRRGLGLYHPDLVKRLGPGLRDVCEVTGGDPELRGKVITRLRDAAATLPPDLSRAVLAALGVHPEIRSLRKLEERVDWLAARLNRDARTARRRMDDACAMLAENLVVARGGPRDGVPSSGWHIETAQSVMLMDTDIPTAIERRVAVAERDGLDQLVLARSIPPAGDGKPDVHAQMLFGGVLGIKQWESESRFRLVLELPTTLRAGDRHEYSILWRQPPGRPMRPHYVLTPVLRVDHYDLHVRFDRQTPPARVYRVSDGFHRDLDEQPREWDEITLDRSGEVHLEFENLAPGHGYGVRWR